MTRAPMVRRLTIALAALGLGLACGDPTAPRDAAARRGEGTMVVSAVMNAVSATTLVLEVSGPGIAPTLVFNLPVVSGVAAGTVTIPAGADRLITARAFDGQTETHRGTRTQTIVAGANAAVTLLLIPLQGSIPITVTLGSLLVTVTPNTATPRVGDTLQFSAAIQDVLGQAASFPVAWASSDTRVAIVEPSGRAIMTGVGTALIVATTNGAAGTASLTVSQAIGPAPPAYLKTWVGGAGAGSQRTDWAIANNWAPAGVPTFTDSVVLGAATFQPSLLSSPDTFRVRDLVLRTGSTLTMNFRGLTVTGGVLSGEGGAIAAGSAAEIRLVNGSRLRGAVPTTVAATNGTVQMSDSARIASLVVRGTGTLFDVNGRRLVITATPSQTGLLVQSGGVLVMDSAADTVDVGGQANFQSSAGTHSGSLTAGALILRADLSDGARLEASGTHTVSFAATTAAQQYVYNMDRASRPANVMQQAVISGTAAVYNCSPNWRVAGPMSIVASDSLRSCTSWIMTVGGPFSAAAGSVVVPYGIQLDDATGTANVAGIFAPPFTTLSAANATVRVGLQYQDLTLLASNALTDSVRVAGTLTVGGSASTNVAINNPAGRPVRVGTLSFQSGATIAMAEATDSLVVLNNVEANNASDLSTRLVAGTLRIGGTLNGQQFGATGSHRTVFDGTSPSVVQFINSMDVNSRPSNTFANLDIANTGLGVQVCFSNVRILGTLRVLGTASFGTCVGNFIRVDGPVITAAGSTVSTTGGGGFSLYNAAGTSNVAGTWTPASTDFAVAGATMAPGLAYQTVRFFASGTVPAGVTLSGSLGVDGATTVLTFPDGRVSVQDLNTSNGARISMDAGDTVVVRGNTNFFGGTSAPSGGVLELRGNWNGNGYAPTGTHELRMAGTGAQTINSINDVILPTLRIRSGSATQIYFINLVARDSFLVETGATFGTVVGNTMTVRGRFATATGSTVNPYAVNLEGTATLQLVNGAFTPTIVRVIGAGTGPGTALRNAPGIQYTNVEFYTSYALSDSLSMSGAAYASGAGVVLDLNGQVLRAPLGLNFDNNASGRMANANDVLIVGNGSNATNALLWDSGTSGTVSNGTIVVRGGTTSMTNFVATGTNRVIFTDTGFVSASRQSPINGGATFRRLTIRGQSGYTVSPNFGTYTVTDSLRVESGTLNVNFSTVDVAGAGQAVLFQGSSAVINGNGSVNLASVTGTSLVQAGALFTPAIVRFTAANPTVNPALGYNNVEFYGPVTFSGNTNISGYLFAQNAGAGVALGGQRVNVGNYVDMGTNAFLVMNSAADTLDVAGDIAVDGGVPSTLTNGVILFRGSTFTGSSFVASTPHKMVFLGTSGAPQNVNGNTTFGNVEVAGARGFSANGSSYLVTGSMAFTSAVPLAGSGTLTVQGPLSASAPIAITVAGLRLRHASGTSNLQPGTTFGTNNTLALSESVGSASALQPGLAYNTLWVESPVTLTGTVSLAGNLGVGINSGFGLNPSLTFNGNAVRVAGQVDVYSSGRLIMNQPADTLQTTGTGYVYIQTSAGANGDLSNGTIEVSGDFYPYAPSHQMSGTHRVVLRRNDSRTQIVQQSGTVAIANLEVTGTGSRTVTFNAAQDILGTFQVTSPANIVVTQSSGYLLRVAGAFSAPATTTLSLPGVLQTEHATGISNLLGPTTLGQPTFGGWQIVGAAGQVIPTDSRYTIANLTVAANSNATVASGTRRIGAGLNGTTTITGASALLTVPSGSTYTSCAIINLSTNGQLSISGGTVNSRNAPSVTSGASITGGSVIVAAPGC